MLFITDVDALEAFNWNFKKEKQSKQEVEGSLVVQSSH